MQLIAKTLAGLEEVLAAELQELGAYGVMALKRAVSFEGDKRLLYRANLELRTALRILVPIRRGRVSNENQLYDLIRQIDWSKYMGVNDTLAVDGITNSELFRHSKYVALVTKDAVVDQFREREGRRPSVNVYAPKLRINVHIFGDECTVSIDSSDDSLHKRGYRISSVEAPINEALAAGMVLMSGWRGESPFVDPMCGSGTILIEAGLIAARRAPQLTRDHFGFKRWPDFDEALWNELLEAAKQRVRPAPFPLLGYDKDFKAVRLTEQNAMAAGLEHDIAVKRKALERLDTVHEQGVLIMNPPYDERLTEKDIGAFYKMIGDRLKQQFPGFAAWIISGNKEGLLQIGLKAAEKHQLMNGGIECRYAKYELYSGSKEEALK